MDGQYTREYKSVQQYMCQIYQYLEVNPEARKLLIAKYQQEGWIEISEQPESNTIVPKALFRIKSDASQYHTFMKMLKEIVGMDIIWKQIEGI